MRLASRCGAGTGKRGKRTSVRSCRSMNRPAKPKRYFIEEHANDLLVVSASGDWHQAVPKGMVGVSATIQGSREPGSKQRHFLVSKAEYDTRTNNPGGIFVIDQPVISLGPRTGGRVMTHAEYMAEYQLMRDATVDQCRKLDY